MAYRISQTDALLQQSWENMLVDESQERDIFSGLTGTYNSTDEKIPDAPIMRVNMPSGANTHTIGLIKDLTGAGREGAGKVLVGFTETYDTRKYVVYTNDLRHGVDNEMYGRYAQLNEPYKILEKANPALSKWLKARTGKYKRQGGLELFSSNLNEAPSSQTLGWNKNWLIKNVAHSAQPSYDSTAADFEGNIKTALTAAGTTAAAQADIAFFTDLQYFITVKWKLKPFDDGSYIVTIPSRQGVYLKRFNTGKATAGDYKSFTSHNAESNSERYIKAAYGQYFERFGKMHLIEDERAPVLSFDTSASTLTAVYRDVGDTDDRASEANSATKRVYDIGYVLGKGGITQSVGMMPRYDDDITDFNRLRSVGISTTQACQATEYDADTATDDTRIAQNMGIICFYSGTATA